MLIGATGTGKTYCLPTFTNANVTPFIIATEPTGVETLIDACRETKTPLDKIHWKLCKPATDSFAILQRQAEIANSKTAGDLQKMEVGLDKKNYPQYIQFLQACQNFVCDRTGEAFGDITEWGPNRALIIDSLSGLNVMVTRNQCGNRLTMTQPEFGIAQNVIEGLITVLTGLNCYFVLTVHPEYERDEVEGTNRIMASTIGKKLAPKVPRFFSEVITTRKDGHKFFWSTESSKVDTKCRILPIASDLKPNFGKIVDGHEKRLELIAEAGADIGGEIK